MKLKTLSIVFLVIVMHTGVFAQPGTLDNTFGSNGIATTLINTSSYNELTKIQVQTDGKIIAAGFINLPTGRYAVSVVRYQASGKPDSSFGNNGIVIVPQLQPNANDFSHDLKLLPNGQIVVAGESAPFSGKPDLFLLLLKSNGIVDSSFGDNGKIFTDFEDGDEHDGSIIFQKDRKVVIAGSSGGHNGSNKFVIARYKSNASPDSSFGTNGKIITRGLVQCFLSDAAIQKDGKIVVVGGSAITSSFDNTLIRYNTNGTLDPSFGNGGKTFTHVNDNTNALPASISILPNGKFVVGGLLGINGTFQLGLFKYNANGTLDSTFNGNGIVISDLSDRGIGAIALQPDGKIIQAGGLNGDFLLVRYNADGTKDNSFGTNGTVTTPVGSFYTGANSVALQKDGKIVAAGPSQAGHFILARYLNDNNLFTSFAVNNESIKTLPSHTQSIFVYPNPAKDILHIQVSGKASVSLINQSGKTLITTTINNKGEMNIAHLSAGLYYLKNNATGAVQKVIVNK